MGYSLQRNNVGQNADHKMWALHYYGYRYYEPNTGRWVSRDPIEEARDINLYGYINNRPIGAFDILGLMGDVVDQLSYNPRDHLTGSNPKKVYGKNECRPFDLEKIRAVTSGKMDISAVERVTNGRRIGIVALFEIGNNIFTGGHLPRNILGQSLVFSFSGSVSTECQICTCRRNDLRGDDFSYEWKTYKIIKAQVTRMNNPGVRRDEGDVGGYYTVLDEFKSDAVAISKIQATKCGDAFEANYLLIEQMSK